MHQYPYMASRFGEGDHSNARYWYTKANAKMPAIDTSLEWENLVEEFLAGQD